jgi:hypothetical protein
MNRAGGALGDITGVKIDIDNKMTIGKENESPVSSVLSLILQHFP